VALSTVPTVLPDFVHLALILLRRHGIAARYASGYLFAAPEDGGADSVEVDAHAWLEALLPGTAAFTATCRRSRASTGAPPRRSTR
jgi:transglutaminase-like putative cysteine protease